MLRLNLGAGLNPHAGWTTVDYHHPADMRVDLFQLPWPWKPCSVDAVMAEDFFEHVPDLWATLIEAYRVLKPNGTLIIMGPHARSGSAYAWGHRWCFTHMTFQTLEHPPISMDNQMPHFYRLSYRVIVGHPVLDWIASRWPARYEKLGICPPHSFRWVGQANKEYD